MYDKSREKSVRAGENSLCYYYSSMYYYDRWDHLYRNARRYMNSIRLSAVIISSTVQRTCSNLPEPVPVTVAVCNIHDTHNDADLEINRLSFRRGWREESGFFFPICPSFSRTSSGVVISRSRLKSTIFSCWLSNPGFSIVIAIVKSNEKPDSRSVRVI